MIWSFFLNCYIDFEFSFIGKFYNQHGVKFYNCFYLFFNILGQMGGYYNPYTSGFSAAHMAAAAAAAAAQQSGQVIELYVVII